MKISLLPLTLLGVALAWSGLGGAAQAQTTHTWNVAGGGDWGVAGNWSPASVPNSNTIIADFSTQNLAADRTITQNSNISIRGLKFGDADGTPHNTTLGNTGNNIAWGASGITTSIEVVNGTATVANRLIAAGGLLGTRKLGTGTLRFMTTSNSYGSNGLSIEQGVVEYGSNSANPFSSGIVFAGGTLHYTFGGSGLNQGGNFTVNSAGGTLRLTGGTSEYRFNGVDQLRGSGTLVVNGGGTFFISQNQNTFFTGTLDLQESGTSLRINSASMLNATVNLGAGTEFRVYGGTSPTIGRLTGTGVLSPLSSVTSITIGDNGASPFTFAGAINGAMSITKAGTSSMLLTAASTYTGTTTVNGGVLSINAENRLGNNPSSFNAAHLNLDGGTLAVTSSFSIDDANRGITLGASHGAINTNANTLTIANAIAGTGNLTKLGSGTLVRTAGGSYSGSTLINEGVMNIRNSTALGNTAGGTSVASGAALELQTGITVTGEALTLTGGGVSNTGALRNISGNNTWTGGVAINGVTRIASDANQLTMSGAAVIASGQRLILQGAGNGLYSGNISGGSAGTDSLVRDATGAGTWTLSGTNTYSGATVVNGGTLAVSGGAAIPNTSQVRFDGAGLLQVLASETVGSIRTNVAGASISLGGGTVLTTGGDNSSTTFAGQLTGAGGLTKTGGGTMNLTGANNYNGATIVNGGVLRVNGAHTSNGNYTINNGGTLAGAGSIAQGLVTINSGGTIDPGNSIDLLNVPDLTLATGSTALFEIAGVSVPGVDFDVVQGGAGDTLTYGGPWNLTLQFLADIVGTHSIQIFDFDNYSGAAAPTFSFINSGASSISYNNTTGMLTFTDAFVIVPEPSTFVLLALGTVGVYFAARRRRKTARLAS